MIDDDLLMAYADGELDEVGRARVERALAADGALRARLEQQQRLRAMLAAHYGPTAEEEVPARLRAMLETNVVRFPPPRPRPIWRGMVALAASLVLGLALGRTLLAPAGGPVEIEHGAMVARGPLADALDLQLASAQPAGAPVRMGISFAAADGRLCRTFDSAALSGLACRGDRGWQVMMTAAGAGGPRGDYRQAGSGNPLVAQAAQELMTGEALDAAGERRARDAGWRRR
ncbi:MAG TPA: zf-HC2 domain-containing protein [Allosphingosinicella sp.]|nr:zf-HC2 domain-containing protein [Allosphingosinicella sp.]